MNKYERKLIRNAILTIIFGAIGTSLIILGFATIPHDIVMALIELFVGFGYASIGAYFLIQD